MKSPRVHCMKLEGRVYVLIGIPGFCRCKNHGMSAKQSCRHGVKAGPRDKSNVLCWQQSWCGGLNENSPHRLTYLNACPHHQGTELRGKDAEMWPCWRRCATVDGL